MKAEQALAIEEGLELLEKLQKEHPEIPVIIMTSYGTIEDAVHFLQSGAHDYITNPDRNCLAPLNIHESLYCL